MIISAGRTFVLGRELLSRDPATKALFGEGERSSAAPGHGAYRPDRLTSRLAIQVLESHRPRCLVVSLGDPDEHAHAGDYRGYLRALGAFDTFVSDLLATLERIGRSDSTAVLITTDHGRAAGFRSHGRTAPESARVWLFATGAGVTRAGLVNAPRLRALADVQPTALALLGLPLPPGEGRGAPLDELLVEPPSGGTRGDR